MCHRMFRRRNLSQQRADTIFIHSNFATVSPVSSPCNKTRKNNNVWWWCSGVIFSSARYLNIRENILGKVSRDGDKSTAGCRPGSCSPAPSASLVFRGKLSDGEDRRIKHPGRRNLRQPTNSTELETRVRNSSRFLRKNETKRERERKFVHRLVAKYRREESLFLVKMHFPV